MQLIDTHVHINFDVFNSDLEDIRQRWQQAGVVHLVHSCVEPEEFNAIKSIADRFPELSYAVGLHPLDAHKWTSTTATQIEELAASDPQVVAIGETGLDFYKADNQEQQKFVFRQQLTIAKKLNKPLIIHCRDAAQSMAEIIDDFQKNQGLVRGVMHCWGGNPEETKIFIDLGFYISFSGTVTFKKAIQIQESAKVVDDDRLLVETDCPFLAPVPKRGKRNEPAYVKYVAEKVAELRNVTLESLALQTSENACRLFGLSIDTKNT
ncbi:MAG: TatD family hydrolase [Okeania sp. SIO2C9]|uniref:TatD family hydrolase n=1 Tax=Okeania sp. SIO2C9 TaxID=2607791 RepID=UPI0013BF413D|nr:TatD family hydrolase [Okeania sp. SIO2C9]NEQ74199.1 TatD family hydrolase [Okeania sp. SIO2C9]